MIWHQVLRFYNRGTISRRYIEAPVHGLNSALATALDAVGSIGNELKWDARFSLAAQYRAGSYTGPFESNVRAAERQDAAAAAFAFARAIRAAARAIDRWRQWEDASRFGSVPSPGLPLEFMDPYRARGITERLWGGFLYWKALARSKPAAPSLRREIAGAAGQTKAVA